MPILVNEFLGVYGFTKSALLPLFRYRHSTVLKVECMLGCICVLQLNYDIHLI